MVVLVGVLTAIFSYLENNIFPSFTGKQICLFSAFFGWISIASLWSINPIEALKLDLRLVGVTIAGLLLLNAVEAQGQETKRRIAKALLVGVILACIFLLVESLLNAPITKTIKGKELDATMNLSRFNRGASFLGISLWLVFVIYSKKFSFIWKLLFPILPLALLYFAPSESSLLAVVLAAVWYLAFCTFPKVGFRVLPVVLIISVLSMPLVTRYVEPLYDAQSSQSIPFSAKHRFFIWDFVSSQILENPIRGWGFDSARDYPNNGVENYVHVNAKGDQRALEGRIISLHPHNFALQVWLELGLIGAILVSIIIWMVFGYLKSRQLAERIEIQAMLVSTFIVALLGYGIWQNRWFVMFFIFAAMLPLIQKKEDKEIIGEVDEYGA
ncbi:O-antigen ligase family protein [Kiloniella spongiae]|uniref:O-antigen ligase family protein n=1 Tax=Kiloniella spongiae TaxID=1489064 RepID=UPI00138DD4F8|nr:O-antigen ligase family protein [Kiloniella spongiae]